MSEMFTVEVTDVGPGVADLTVTQAHPDCSPFSVLLEEDILAVVGVPGFRYEAGTYLPASPLAEALGSFDSLFDRQNARRRFETYFPRSAFHVIHDVYSDDDLVEALEARGLEQDTDEWDEAEAEVRDEIRGRLTLHLEASDPRWTEHFKMGARWSV